MALQKPSPMIIVSVGPDESSIGGGHPSSHPAGSIVHPTVYQGAGGPDPPTPPAWSISSSMSQHHPHPLTVQNKASAWARTAAHVLRDPPEAAAETVGKLFGSSIEGGPQI